MSERLNYIKDNGLAEAIDENIDMSDIGRLRIADDIKFLIEQAEQNKEHNIQISKVRDYLQETKVLDDDINYWGMNVIDVLLSVSKEQKERIEEIYKSFMVTVDELVEETAKVEELKKSEMEWINFQVEVSNAFHYSELEIKRYREALEFYAERMFYPPSKRFISSIEFDRGVRARQALEDK